MVSKHLNNSADNFSGPSRDGELSTLEGLAVVGLPRLAFKPLAALALNCRGLQHFIFFYMSKLLVVHCETALPAQAAAHQIIPFLGNPALVGSGSRVEKEKMVGNI